MASKWQYQGDVNMLDYGGVFLRHVGGRKFHAIRFDNMHEATGEEDQDKYYGSLVEVDLDTADLDGARSCCGIEGEVSDLELAFAVTYHGQYAPLSDESGNNGNRILRDLKRESREIESDSDRYEELMERPVNLLGSTAREVQRGDYDSAIQRGVRAGDRTSELMAKLTYQPQPVSMGVLTPDGVKDEVVIDMALTGSDDPLAFAYGFTHGMRGEPMADDDDLAEEYIRGHGEGLKVHNGGELPAFVTRK